MRHVSLRPPARPLRPESFKLVAGLLLFVIPVVGPLFTVLVLVIVGLAAVAVWLVLVVKALRGEMFKLPVLGDYAEQQANTL